VANTQAVFKKLEEGYQQFTVQHRDIQILHDEAVSAYRALNDKAALLLVIQLIVAIEDARHRYHNERARAVLERRIPEFLQKIRELL